MGADGKGVFGFGFVGDGQGDDRCGSAGRWCDGQDRRKSTIYISRKRMTYGLKHFWGKNSYRCKLARRKSQLVRLLLFLLKKGTICRPSLSLKPLPPPLPSSPNNSPRRSPESKRRQSRKRGNSQGMREGTMNTRRSNIPNHCSLVSRDCAWPYLHRAHGALTSILFRLQESSLSTDEISKLKGTGRHGMLTKGDVLHALGKVKNRYGSAEKYNVDVMGPSGKRLSERGVAKEVEKKVVLDGPALRRLVVGGMAKATQPAHPIIHHGSSKKKEKKKYGFQS